MKTATLILFALQTATLADEAVTLIAPDQNPSPALTLAQGDVAELKFMSVGQGSAFHVKAGGVDFNFFAQSPATTGPVTVAGPAEIRYSSGGAFPAFATFSVKRAGTASGPVPIPQEAGTTWTVILEASSDLVNWTAVQPGDYPSSTPQRYFRTRLVKKT